MLRVKSVIVITMVFDDDYWQSASYAVDRPALTTGGRNKPETYLPVTPI